MGAFVIIVIYPRLLVSVSLEYGETKVFVNDRETDISTLLAKLILKNSLEQFVYKEIAVTNELNGLGKLVYLKETNASGVTTTKLKAVRF